MGIPLYFKTLSNKFPETIISNLINNLSEKVGEEIIASIVNLNDN